jgi:hypothetical protein
MRDIIKKYMSTIILLFVIALVWAWFAFFLDSKSSYSESGIAIYTNPMAKSFSQEGLDDVDKRTLNTLPVSPKEFINLTKGDN